MTASVAIKTLILRSFKTSVQTVADLKTVTMNPGRGLREEADKPYCNLFSMPESAKKTDLYREGDFDIEVHTWAKEDTDELLDEKLHDLIAKVQVAVLPRGSAARQYVITLEETGKAFDTLFYGDGLGVGISTYHVKYRHVYGNPFQLNP